MKTRFYITVFILLHFCAKTQTLTIPTGVVYNYGSKEVNENGLTALKTELSAGANYNLFNGMLFIGPQLWSEIKDSATAKSIKGGNTTFELPIRNEKGKVIKMEKLTGKLIQTKDDYKVLVDFIKRSLIKGDYQVRKLNEDELTYYWSVISYDINEPVYILEYNNVKYIIDLELENGKYVLQWFDKVN